MNNISNGNPDAKERIAKKMRIREVIEANKCVRFFALPYVRVRNKLRVRNYGKSEDSKYVKSLKDIHKNESCFIIGNGPSLLAEDLDKLNSAGTPSFGVNRIFHIFPNTAWRPTYYLCLDTYLAMIELDEIKQIGDFPKFLNCDCAPIDRKPEDQIHYLCLYRKFMVNPRIIPATTMSSDVSIFSQRASTVVANAIELAVYMGFTTIYLIGVDNNYKLKRVNGKVCEDPSVKNSYFSQMKDRDVLPSIQDVDFMTGSYIVCKKLAEEHGVKIYNATRGGKLEVFERVDFDEVMEKLKQKDE